MVDERVHSRQIGLFLSGETTVHEQLTQIPGYHVVMAAAVVRSSHRTGAAVAMDYHRFCNRLHHSTVSLR